jgi:vacuolar-type H+-ATPase subunit E/Vma4
MSAGAIVAAIRAESDAEAERILAAARDEAARLESAAGAARERHVTAAMEAVEPELAGDAARRVNAARLRLLHARARRRADRVASVFDAAAAELDAVVDAGGRRWTEALHRLRELAIETIGVGAEIDQRAGDGVRAQSPDGRVRLDLTVEVRLGRARVLLADAVAEVLEL